MTWITDFHERTDLNRYPVKLRTRGGIGYGLPNGDTVSNFVGHPVHYLENGIWKPITLQRHMNGDLEGSPFAFKGGQVTYKDAPLFQPRAVIFDGKRYPLNLAWRDTSLVCDLPFGTYEVRFTENGVRELLTIPEPVEGTIEFDVPHVNKPRGLFKQERHIVGGVFGESFTLTKDMKFPLEIDPDYSGDTASREILGASSVYATARSTATSLSSSEQNFLVSHSFGSSTYSIRRIAEKFLTSGIPDTDTITQVNLTYYVNSKSIVVDDDIIFAKANWSANEPLSAPADSTYDLGLSAALEDNIWKNTSSISAGNAYASGNLNTSWVSKTGSTYYVTLFSRDRNNSGTSNGNSVTFASVHNSTSGNRPYLTVTHAAAAVSQPVWFM